MTAYFLLISVLSLLAFGPPVSKEDPLRLKVMCYNIGFGQRGMPELVKTIQDEAPDILGLQEVDVFWSDRSQFMDQARYLADSLKMHLFYAPIYRVDNPSDPTQPRQFGLALLSKFPILEAQNHEIARLSTQQTTPQMTQMPGFPGVILDVHGRAVRIFNTHLDFRPDPGVRNTQVEQMLAIIGEIAQPTLLMGDLNAGPKAPELQPLMHVFHNPTDIEGASFPTYPDSLPNRQIDFILHSKHFKPLRSYVPVSNASDHRPLVTILELK
jgi:endonuclease/exonuclease/phosphatase family metal-dependent hydrolase